MSIFKDSKNLRLSLNEIELATNSFSEPIGKGGYGIVYRGELSISGRSTTVAVKRLNPKMGQGLKEFLTEIQLLSGQNHKNVVSLLGYCDEGDEKSLVYEYAANGSLDVCLEKKDTSLTWRKRLEICLDAARGLNHLHSNSRNKQTIIHRDIKSGNILLDENWVAKIADLGLSKLNYESPEGSSIVSNACGTKGYYDPGYYNNGILKKECDVYSFGIVLFEVLCGKLCSPYPNKDNGFLLSGPSVQKYYEENKMEEIIDPCLKEHMSSHSISKFSEVAYKCLLKDERKRPSMDHVVKELKELLLIQAIEVKSQKSNSVSLDPVSELRYEKARRIFRRFDVNRDGVLDKDELTNFFQVLGQLPSPSHRDGIRKKIEHMNLLKTKQDFKQKYFGPGLFSKAKDFKHKYFGPGASRTYLDILQDIISRKNIPSCDHPSPVGAREVTKAIENALKLYGETTNGEKGLTWDGMLRFYDNGADVLHDHFELLRLDYEPFDDDEDSSQTNERFEKVKRIFQRFDANKDGYLDLSEVAMFVSFHSNEQDQGLVLINRVLNFAYLYRGFYEDDNKGLDCDGLFQFYSSGIDRLDDDFEKLNLTLKPLDENELLLRYEKVRRIFQRFDINEDGGLNEEELTELLYRQTSESFLVDCIFDVLTGFTNGEKGLTCEGLLHLYGFGVNNGLDDDFKRLRLDLKHLDDREDALRKKERSEKVRMMFERFDLKGDGGLNKDELGRLLLSRNPHVKSLEEIGGYVDKVFRSYAKYIDGDKGLTCDGLLRTYDHGIDSLDVDFEKLALESRTSTETENASRKKERSEKVRKIFKRFDLNGDGGLDRIEMTSYLAAVNLEDRPSEKQRTSNVNYMLHNLDKFVDGVIGLSCDGLIKYYDSGEDNLDAHFEILKLR